MKPIKIFRISTVSQSLRVTLRGQFRYIKSRGFDYTLLCSKDELIDNVAIEEQANYLPLNLTREITPFIDLLALLKLARHILKEKPQIVHTHSPKAGLVGMLASWFCGVPKRIHTVAGLPLVEKTGIIKKVLVFCEKVTYMCASTVIFNSSRQAEYVLENKWINPKKLKVIGKGSSNGIDLSYFNVDAIEKSTIEAIERNYNIKDSDFVIGYVGRMAKPKGVNELVRAFQIIKKEFENVKLLLVGEEEPKEPLDPEIYDIIATDEDIVRIDHQKDVRPYILMSDIFLLPSYREGFPQIIMQACAMNRCVVCTDINGCNEMIENNFNGTLIAPKSTNEIVVAIKRLMEDQQLRETFISNSRKYIEDNFDQKEFWEKLITLYK